MNTEIGPLVVQVVVKAVPLLILATIGIVVLLRRRGGAAPTVAADGATIVPVRGLYLRRGSLLGSSAHNSINPHFAITPDGIRYRVFRERLLAFPDIGHVEVRQRFGFVYLLFVNAGDPRLLSAHVKDRDMARQVLERLPRTVTLTPEAATIRDGTPAAGTSGLHLYRGRFA